MIKNKLTCRGAPVIVDALSGHQVAHPSDNCLPSKRINLLSTAISPALVLLEPVILIQGAGQVGHVALSHQQDNLKLVISSSTRHSDKPLYACLCTVGRRKPEYQERTHMENM